MMNFEESTANQDYAENQAQRYSLCGHSGCGKLVPYNYGEDLCEMHEWEANEDAMDDMLDAARQRPAWILNRIYGHLAASTIPMGAYLYAGRIIEEAIFETHCKVNIDLTWCNWCDRPRNDCKCPLDPNGIPEGHWSLT